MRGCRRSIWLGSIMVANLLTSLYITKGYQANPPFPSNVEGWMHLEIGAARMVNISKERSMSNIHLFRD